MLQARHFAAKRFDEALIDNSRRAPSLVATEKSLLLRVARPDFIAALASWHLELSERKLAALHAVPCLMLVCQANATASMGHR